MDGAFNNDLECFIGASGVLNHVYSQFFAEITDN